MWAGTGVGLVRKSEPAGTIVEGVREEALTILSRLGQKL
jgi:NAD(P)H-dependent flavin oxidoreductase YrpB (nitropropane dioxygenase family)